jgi:hypothetical protein
MYIIAKIEIVFWLNYIHIVNMGVRKEAETRFVYFCLDLDV